MMSDYAAKRLQEIYQRNYSQIMGLRTKAEAMDYCRMVRKKVGSIFKPMPERTPLNMRIAKEIERSHYTIHNLIFESRPNFPVTANLLIPKGRPGLKPAVLCLCGHSVNGKASERNQAIAQSLAKMGYITLIFDPIGQGERLQFHQGNGISIFAGDPKHTVPVLEHNALGRQQILVGEDPARWFLWDAVRALDLLLEQDEVDPARIGVTGNSGGGTLTTYLTAYDERITMAAPSCYISSWYHNCTNELPVDAEQVPFGVLGLGLEQKDLLLAHAPKPILLVTQEQDFFDQRGSLEAYEQLRHVYRLLDAEDQLSYHMGPGTHGYWQDGREAMYAFFNKHARIDHPGREPELSIESEEELCCTATGQVDHSGAWSVFDFTRQKSLQLSKQRGTPSGQDLQKIVRKALNLPEGKPPIHYRVLRPRTKLGYARPYANHYLLETDPEYGVQVVITKLEDHKRVSRPLKGDGMALLYLPHHGSDQELRQDPELQLLQTRYQAFFACDYRGIGESVPNIYELDMFDHLYGTDYHFASIALLLGESYPAWRTYDVLCAIGWIRSFGYDQIHLVAKGWGTIPGVFAAYLSDSVTKVTLIDAPYSYAQMAESKMQKWPLSAMVPNILAYCDLPDLYRELQQKDLELISLRDAAMQPVKGDDSSSGKGGFVS